MSDHNFTVYHIKGATDDVTRLRDFIHDWTDVNYCENDFGLQWLGNIVGNSGMNDPLDRTIFCRGTLEDCVVVQDEQDAASAVLVLRTETLNNVAHSLINELCKHYLPGSPIIYFTDYEEGARLSNDPNFEDMWETVITDYDSCEMKQVLDRHMQDDFQYLTDQQLQALLADALKTLDGIEDLSDLDELRDAFEEYHPCVLEMHYVEHCPWQDILESYDESRLWQNAVRKDKERWEPR